LSGIVPSPTGPTVEVRISLVEPRAMKHDGGVRL
jgi:hypothetical protein